MNQVENTVKIIGIEEMRATLKPQRAFSIHHMQVLKLDVRSSLSHTRARARAHTHTHTHTQPHVITLDFEIVPHKEGDPESSANPDARSVCHGLHLIGSSPPLFSFTSLLFFHLSVVGFVCSSHYRIFVCA